MQQFSDGFLRLFEQVRNNPKSEFLAQFQRPSQLYHFKWLFLKCKIYFLRIIEPIPRDLFEATGYENHYNWIIMSQENTGKLKVQNLIHSVWKSLILQHSYRIPFL